MENVTYHEMQCPLCGKMISYRYYEEDGYDWLGHKRCQASTRVVKERHNCKFKPMCLNCIHFSSDYCRNKDVPKFYKEKIFGKNSKEVKTTSIHINKPTNHCIFYEKNEQLSNE